MYELNEEQLKQVVGGRFGGGSLTVSRPPAGFSHATVFGGYNEAAAGSGAYGGASFGGTGHVSLTSDATNYSNSSYAISNGTNSVTADGYLNGPSNSGAYASTSYGSGILTPC